MVGLKQRNPPVKSRKELKREASLRSDETKPADPSEEAVGARLEDWCPTTLTVWKLLLSSRVCSAVWSGISDCDETYNYWEPTHHLLYGQGMQTWEYDPKYALRSYLYLLVNCLPGWAYAKLLRPNPVLIFFFMRILFAVVSASCEVYFFIGVLREFGRNVARITFFVEVVCAGMFISCTAFLPSTTSLYLALLALGAWFRQDDQLAIFFTALSAILSWPFAALLGVPIAFDIIVRRGELKLFVTWSLISAGAILGPLLMCDTFYYGRPVFASLNIVLYNVFTSHGPELYGTEPASFYLLNGLLNFNLMFPVALGSLPLVHLASLACGERTVPTHGKHLPLALSLGGMYLWLLVFWTRPHKEERFLFPIYPLILLAAGVGVDTAQRLVHFLLNMNKDKSYASSTVWFSVTLVVLSGLISVSRVGALYHHYHGSMDVWIDVGELPAVQHTTTVCVGKEWHRFPSSFFLPYRSYKLAFLQSEFRGQLPKYYADSRDDRLPTMLSHADFNDKNLEEPSRYIAHPGRCHYLVDLDNGEVTPRQPRYSQHANWTTVAAHPFLHAASSHPVFRAFYVPLLDSHFCRYNRYLLLKRTSANKVEHLID